MPRSRTTWSKRQRETRQREKAEEKAARRADRRAGVRPEAPAEPIMEVGTEVIEGA